jgi:hypothetical protein
MPLGGRTNVASWLGTVLTAPDKQRPLYPQLRTSRMGSPLRLSECRLSGREQTSRVEAQEVRF